MRTHKCFPIAHPLPRPIRKANRGPYHFGPDPGADCVLMLLPEAETNRWGDRSDYRHTPAGANVTQILTGFGKAADFSGTGSYLDVTDDNSLRINSDNSFIVSDGTLFEGFDTIGDWTVHGVNASIEHDTTIYKEPSGSLKMHLDSDNTGYAEKTINQDCSGWGLITLDVYVEDESKVAALGLYFASQADYSKQAYVPFTSSLDDGWNKLVFHKDDFTLDGGELWTNTMIRLRVLGTGLNGDEVDIYFDNLRYNYTGKPLVIITHDGNYDTIEDNVEGILDGNSQTACRFVHSGTVGNANMSTLADLTRQYGNGWDICNHGHMHLDFDTLNDRALDSEIDRCWQYLVDNGFYKTAILGAYPLGHYNDTALAIIKRNHNMWRNSTTGSYFRHFRLDNDNIPYLMKANTCTKDTAKATVLEWIDNVIKRQNLLMIVWHSIVDAGPLAVNEWLTADYQDVSDDLATEEGNGNLEVISYYDYMMKVYKDKIGSAIMAWVQVDSITAWDRILGKEDSENFYQLILDSSDKLRYQCEREDTTTNCYSNAAFSTGSWIHVAAVWTPTALNLYINGTLQTSKPEYSGTITDPTSKLCIGARPSHANPFDGKLGELRMFNRPLQSHEILDHYTLTRNNYGV